MSDVPVRSVLLVEGGSGHERALEMAPALRAAGHDVRLAPGADSQLAASAEGSPIERLRAELAALEAAARSAASGECVVLLCDERSALVVAEWMRILLDERGVGWDEAWSAVRRATFCRLGSPKAEPARPFWTAAFLDDERRRLLEILFEINRRHLDAAESLWPGDLERRRRLSLFREGESKRLRPGLLAVLAAGRADVATPWDGPAGEALSDLSVLRGRALHARPTPVFGRAWLKDGSPALSSLLAEALGPSWAEHKDSLGQLETLAFDAGFREAFRAARRGSRERLAALVLERAGTALDPDWLVDVRLWTGAAHERPLLNVLGLVREHLRVAAGGWTPPCGRTVLLAGPVDPRVARVVRAVVEAVDADARARPCLRAAFLPECDEGLLQALVAGADLSNQPGAAGSGAAGPRALALALCGAVTLGTQDGTVRELEEAVGSENLFLFGLGPHETRAWRDGQVYRPADLYALDPLVRIVVDALVSRRYTASRADVEWARRELLDERDPWLVIADFGAYVHRQDDALAEFADARTFSEKAILTIARARRFWVDSLELGP